MYIQTQADIYKRATIALLHRVNICNNVITLCLVCTCLWNNINMIKQDKIYKGYTIVKCHDYYIIASYVKLKLDRRLYQRFDNVYQAMGVIYDCCN